MQAADYLTILNILVAFLGVVLVLFTLFEWRKLRGLKKDFDSLAASIRRENHEAMRAAHRIISSYQVRDADQRIVLLESAVRAYPAAFNGYNALGYAYLEKGDSAKAIDAFMCAVEAHPEDKAGYCDLAYAHLKSGHEDLAVKYFQAAIRVDPSAKQDIINDKSLHDLMPRII